MHDSSRPSRSVTIPLFFLLIILPLTAQQPRGGAWAWIGGQRHPRSEQAHLIRGVPHPDAFPGFRTGAASWRDASGTIWLFGGFKGTGLYPDPFNDLWTYDPVTDTWTWVMGDSLDGGKGIRGAIGQFDTSYLPGARAYSAVWSDYKGDVWLYGGFGADIYGKIGTLGDLWKFDIRLKQWAYMGGHPVRYQEPVYGQQGVPSTTAYPGGRVYATACTGPDGMFYLFGGSSNESLVNKENDRHNDLWQYDPFTGEWTWLSGSDLLRQAGVYEAANPKDRVPGARIGAMSWCDKGGTIWLFGGHGAGASGDLGSLNDFWKYDLQRGEWTWVSGETGLFSKGNPGIKGVASPDNHPRSRRSGILWGRPDGTLYLFGGTTHGGYYSHPPLNGDTAFGDLWRYSPTENSWTWLRGDTAWHYAGIYSYTGVERSEHEAGGRFDAAWWVEADSSLGIFGGIGDVPRIPFSESCSGSSGYCGSYGLSDVCGFNPTTEQWTWIAGHIPFPTHELVPKGDPARAIPNSGSTAGTWIDRAGNFWMYNTETRRMWKYAPASGIWTPVQRRLPTTLNASDSTAMKLGSAAFGIRGVASPSNFPGSRSDAATWIDRNGSLWMYGGLGYASFKWSPNAGFPMLGTLSDLWKYDPGTNLWTWMGGDTLRDVATDGVTRVGARSQMAYWTDRDGQFWLFGGYGKPTTTIPQWKTFNDLWKYDMGSNQWMCVKGGINPPDQRFGSASCLDPEGNLLLFGGRRFDTEFDGYYNCYYSDLWRYHIPTNSWTRLWSYQTRANMPRDGGLPVHETRYVPSDSVRPGGRTNASMWIDQQGHINIIGGSYSTRSGLFDHYNSMFRYDTVAANWMWISGDSVPNQARTLLAQGIAMPANTPSSMAPRQHWQDSLGNIWMFTSGYPTYRDFWKLDGNFSGMSVPVDAGKDLMICEGDSAVIGSSSEPGMIYRWEQFAVSSSRITVTPTTTRSYVVTAHDPLTGGIGIDTVVVTVIPLPRATYGTLVRDGILHCAATDPHATDFHWDFGDGTTSTERTPTHQYPTPEPHVVTLTVHGDCGSDTARFIVGPQGTSTVVSKIPTVSEFNIRPIPARTVLRIDFTLKHPAPVSISLVTMQGEVVSVQDLGILGDGQHSLPCELPVHSGSYILRLSAEEMVLSQQIIVVR